MHFVIPLHILARQQAASDPKVSGWVCAHAGSGKTHVLMQRVLRLLLEGKSPQKILCLTFTKMAAANMAARIFSTLGIWTKLEEPELKAALRHIGLAEISEDQLSLARRLFAQMLEPENSLRIQTIHAFCEQLLHQFPFEAGVSPQFTILENIEQKQLLRFAQESALQALRRETEELQTQKTTQEERDLKNHLFISVFPDLLQEVSAEQFEEAVAQIVKHRADFSALLQGNIVPLAEKFRHALGLRQGEWAKDLEKRMGVEGLSSADYKYIFQKLRPLEVRKQQSFCSKGEELLAQAENGGEVNYATLFLTQQGHLRKETYLNKKMRTQEPEICEQLDQERARVQYLWDRLKAAKAMERTLILFYTSAQMMQIYEAVKQEKHVLDFDDLIERTLRLLTHPETTWVAYRLDKEIEHLLVDEAQDIAENQWKILSLLIENFSEQDFFAQNRPKKKETALKRTFFVVGDEKQSIFSFQGAAPKLFHLMRKSWTQAEEGEAARRDKKNVALTLSFRSAPSILSAVDQVFANPLHAQGLFAGDTGEEGRPTLAHESLKQALPGFVEIWPPVPAPIEETEEYSWRMPRSIQLSQGPAQIVVQRMAERIAEWLKLKDVESGERTGPKDAYVYGDNNKKRLIRAEDILILVRKREGFFEPILETFGTYGISVHAAERRRLAEHIAVMDLIAAGRVSLLPEDDFSLACLLKSPFFSFRDEDLIRLAPERKTSLMAALAHHSDVPSYQKSLERLYLWQGRAQQVGPWTFYVRLLGEEGGRQAFMQRLGEETAEVLDAFLDVAAEYEREKGASLSQFLAELEESDLPIAQDQAFFHNSVRLMTIHAAKGLEAKIVFLLDAGSGPTGRHDPPIFLLPTERGSLPLWSIRQEDDPFILVQEREKFHQAAEEEHSRLLYVAMTRAEERLYVMTFQTVPEVGALHKISLNSWYGMIWKSLEKNLAPFPSYWDSSEKIFRWDISAPSLWKDSSEEIVQELPKKEEDLPPWLFQPISFP